MNTCTHKPGLTMKTPAEKKPIFILGCPRSGTLLMSRIIGGYSDNFLITEHSLKNKRKSCPEDVSGIEDHALWWSLFDFDDLEAQQGRPQNDIPRWDEQKIGLIRDIYLKKAQGKRLVIKNAANILRIEFLQKMFPEALYVFCIRNPWHTLQSMTIKNNNSFVLRTDQINQLDDDLFIKAAASWNISIRSYIRHKDNHWWVVKYEELLENPEDTIHSLFDFLDITDSDYLQKAIHIPLPNNKNYFFIKNKIEHHPSQKQIFQMLEEGCHYFVYDIDPWKNQGNRLKYYLEILTKKVRSIVPNDA